VCERERERECTCVFASMLCECVCVYTYIDVSIYMRVTHMKKCCYLRHGPCVLLPVPWRYLLCACVRCKDWNTLQNTATHRGTWKLHHKLRHTAMHCNTMQCTATHCNTLHHAEAHCNTLRHPTSHCNTLQHTLINRHRRGGGGYLSQHTCPELVCVVTHYNTLQHTATPCNTPPIDGCR